MKKQYKSSITNNHKIKKEKYFFDGIHLKGYITSEAILRFCARN